MFHHIPICSLAVLRNYDNDADNDNVPEKVSTDIGKTLKVKSHYSWCESNNVFLSVSTARENQKGNFVHLDQA